MNPDTRYGARRMYFSDTRYQIPYSFYGIWIQIPDTRYQIRRARRDVIFRYQIPDTRYGASVGMQLSDTRYQIPCSFYGIWISMTSFN